MTGEAYQEFDDAALTRFRRRLLRTKGGPKQREFLRTVRNNEEFLRYIRNSVTTIFSNLASATRTCAPIFSNLTRRVQLCARARAQEYPHFVLSA